MTTAAVLTQGLALACTRDAVVSEVVATWLRAFPAVAALALALTAGCRLQPHATPKQVAQPAPAFALPDENGKEVTLASLLERGPVVIVFYRGHW